MRDCIRVKEAPNGNCEKTSYGVATISRLLKIIGLFCRILSLLSGSFAKETCNFKGPTNRSHPIWQVEEFVVSPRIRGMNARLQQWAAKEYMRGSASLDMGISWRICGYARLRMQCVAVCCSVLQCVAVCCSVLHIREFVDHLRMCTTTYVRSCGMLQCVAVCCSVLQCVAVCCTFGNPWLIWMCTNTHAVCCSALQCVAVCCSVLQCVAVCCSVLQCVAVHLRTGPTKTTTHAVCCSVLQYVAVCCSVMQCIAVCCSVLQYICGQALQGTTTHAVCCSVLQCIAVHLWTGPAKTTTHAVCCSCTCCQLRKLQQSHEEEPRMRHCVNELPNSK